MKIQFRNVTAFIAAMAFGFVLNVSMASAAMDTTIVVTSFESPTYLPGSIHGQNGWTVIAGAGGVVTDSVKAHEGQSALNITGANLAAEVRHTAYSGTVPGVSGIVYVDVWVKIVSSATKEFTIVGYDLFGGSIKRSFLADFSLPVNDTGSVRLNQGGATKARIGRYQAGVWNRISLKVNYNAATVTGCLNGTGAQAAPFRESYTPTASGTRQAGIKEYHQLRFNLGGGTSEAAVGSVDAWIDQLAVGTSAPEGVDFGGATAKFTVTVNQPAVGSIALSPAGGQYDAGTTVKAALSIPPGYKNSGWNGDVSGTDSALTFQVTKNMTIGAVVAFDSLNPPAMHRVTVMQPAFGTIALDPAPVRPDSFYAHTKVTATLVLQPAYRNIGWIRGLTGTALSGTVMVVRDTVFAANVGPVPLGVRQVFSSASSFKTAVKTATAGDTIELTNGAYDIGKVSLSIIGTPDHPIRIRAANRGAAELNGGSGFIFTYCSYVVLEGFVFTGDPGTAVKFESCNNIRITRNVFRLSETSSGKWILIGGRHDQQRANSHHNRIDHNLFEEKHIAGNFITLDGSPDNMPDGSVNPTPEISQYDRIDHNHFRNIGPRVVNEMEAVRLGVSHMTQSSAFCVVEHNLFEDCDGDPEIVSGKSSDNTIRFNTFRRSLGTVCLRAGNRTTVEGNYFFGEGKTALFTEGDGSSYMIGTGGIRAYSDDHKIFNNYFEGLTGDRWDAAITLTNGDVDYPSTSFTSHFRPRRIVVAFNTLVNNAHNIQIGYTGSGYNKPPQDLVIANNIVSGSQFELVKHFTAPLTSTYAGNIGNASGSAVLGITASASEFLPADPQLQLADSVWWLTPSSPAVNAAAGIFDEITTDIQGQPRTGAKDAGSDEYSTAPVLRRPLTAADVGPNAREDMVTDIHEMALNRLPSEITLFSNYPNPFNPTTTISYRLPARTLQAGGSAYGKVSLRVFDVLGREVAVLIDGMVEAGSHSIQFDATGVSSGVYFARLSASGCAATIRMALLR